MKIVYFIVFALSLLFLPSCAQTEPSESAGSANNETKTLKPTSSSYGAEIEEVEESRTFTYRTKSALMLCCWPTRFRIKRIYTLRSGLQMITWQ